MVGGGKKKIEVVIRTVVAQAKKADIDQFTTLCKNLQKRQEKEDVEGEPAEPEVSSVDWQWINVKDAGPSPVPRLSPTSACLLCDL